MKVKLDILEYRLIFLAAIINKTEDEVQELDEILNNKINWCEVSGQIVNHRLCGYFFNGLNETQKKRLPKELRAYLKMIVRTQNSDFIDKIEALKPILEDFDSHKISYCGLKGILFNADCYSPSDRRSNDVDLMVLEQDLQKLDKILRKFGFIQSFRPNGELVEASKREKLIQLMNYHDLVPYVKRHGNNILEIDINFKFDSKENDIDKEIFELGIKKYSNSLYSIDGLTFEANLLFLCIHFYREATNTIWTNGRRDVVLYKVIDIINFIRSHSKEFDVKKWCELAIRFNLRKKCYYTFYTLNEFIEDVKIEEVLKLLKTSDEEFINEIHVDGSEEVLKRKKTFMQDAFDWRL